MDATASLVEGYQSVRQLEKLEKRLLQLHIIYGAVATSFWRFRQFNIIYPDAGKNHVYTEMMNLANQVDTIPESDFHKRIFSDNIDE